MPAPARKKRRKIRTPKHLRKKSGRPTGFQMAAPKDPDRVRQIVHAREVEQVSYEVIAKRLGISRVAVRLQYIRWKDHPCTGKVADAHRELSVL